MASGGAPSGGNAGGQLEDILSLVLARSRGEVGNDSVEEALSSIVAEHAPPPSSSSTKATAAASAPTVPKSRDGIIPDEGNYDDDSDDGAPANGSASKGAAAMHEEIAAAKKAAAPIRDKNCPRRQEAMEKIPLGKMGERMLVTFGDGPVPDPEVVSATLLGTRASLQRVVLDARALRRRLKDQWHQARAVATMHRANASNLEIQKTSTQVQSLVADNELSFRAMDGHADALRYDVPCGFDVSQLDVLFPEEMGAYQRWKKMHEAYAENSEELPQKSSEGYDSDKGNDDGGGDLETTPDEEGALNSERLTERLANFDARTTHMGGIDSYLKFADVRRGSFLPRSGAKTREWRERQRTKKRGRPSRHRSTWAHLHPSSVVFLHWMGFDPTSALSPPNEETTQALGFLAYDFFGKIVEKAVALRLESKVGKGVTRRRNSPLVELTGGDQLEKGNIERTIAETDLKSLYSSSNVDLGDSAKIAQLYFGPGFEERLELEMDELFGGSKEKVLSQAELDARKEEENLFARLPHAPALLSNAADVLDDEQDGDARKKARQTK